jgi:hypothetical protein
MNLEAELERGRREAARREAVQKEKDDQTRLEEYERLITTGQQHSPAAQKILAAMRGQLAGAATPLLGVPSWVTEESKCAHNK